MGRKSKAQKPMPQIRSTLADNVRELRDARFAAQTTETERNKALAKAAGTSLSQIQRVLRKTSGIGIDGLEGLSRALKCRPQDLITPYYSSAGVVLPETRAEEKHMFSGRRAS